MAAYDDSTWLPEAIVLGPGGTKGYMQLGALKYMYDNDLLENVKTWIGCSIGSIISLLMQVGFTPNEIIYWSADVELLNDASTLKIADIIKNVGVVSNDDIKKTLKDMIESKLGYVPSLEQLYRTTGYEFTVVTVRIISPVSETVYISRKTNPYLSCIDAVLLSSNIPYVFHRLSFNGYYHIDGAFRNCYPVNVVDDGETNVLGIYIMSDPGIDYENITTYTALTVYSPINAMRDFIIENSSKKCKHMKLMCGQLSAGGLVMGPEQRGALAAIGVNKCKRFFDELATNGDDADIIVSDEVEFVSSEDDDNSVTPPPLMIPGDCMIEQIEQVVTEVISTPATPTSVENSSSDDNNDIIGLNSRLDGSMQDIATRLMANTDTNMDINAIESLARELLQHINHLKET